MDIIRISWISMNAREGCFGLNVGLPSLKQHGMVLKKISIKMCPSIQIQAARSCHSATCHAGSACHYSTCMTHLSTHWFIVKTVRQEKLVIRCDCRMALNGSNRTWKSTLHHPTPTAFRVRKTRFGLPPPSIKDNLGTSLRKCKGGKAIQSWCKARTCDVNDMSEMTWVYLLGTRSCVRFYIYLITLPFVGLKTTEDVSCSSVSIEKNAPFFLLHYPLGLR